MHAPTLATTFFSQSPLATLASSLASTHQALFHLRSLACALCHWLENFSPSSLLDYALISSGLCSNVITLSKVAHSDTPLPRHIPLNNAEVRGTKSSHSRISQYNLKQPCAYVDPHQRLKIHLTLDAHWLISSPQIPLRHNILLLKPLYKQYIRNLLSTVHTHSTLFNHDT